MYYIIDAHHVHRIVAIFYNSKKKTALFINESAAYIKKNIKQKFKIKKFIKTKTNFLKISLF